MTGDRPGAPRGGHDPVGRDRGRPDGSPPRSRREFLATSGTAFGGAWLAANFPALEAMAAWARTAAAERRPFSVLTEAEARELGAVAERILPADELGPGALEVGVVHFMDRAFETIMAGALDFARAGLGDLAAAVAAGPGGEAFSELGPDEQDAVLRTLEDGPFFGLVWVLTMMGFFGDPSLGGNRDRAGWRLIGFEDAGAYQPPFGYYDAEYARENGGGES